MKILHLDSEKSWRGGEQQMEWLVEELTGMNYKNVLGLRKKSAAYERFIQSETEVFALSFQTKHLISDALKLKRYCIDNSVDIIHAHASKAHTVAVIAAIFGNRIPIVVARRVDFPVSRSFFSRFKYNHASIAAYICVSDFVRTILCRSIKNSKLAVTVYDGIDFVRHNQVGAIPDLRKEFGIAKDVQIVANIAALAPHKDYDTFLKTAFLLKKRGFRGHFLIAGEGPERARIEALIVDMELHTKVHLCGFRDDIPGFLKSIDLLLYTSKEEGLGSTLLDAQYAGVPIVSTNAGGIPEILPPQSGGICCPVGDSFKLAEQVENVLSNKELQLSLSKAGKSWAESFNCKRMAVETAAIYEMLKITN